MAQVIWTDDAVRDVGQIVQYIMMFDPAAANRMGLRLIAAAESLAEFPNRGRPVRDGYRQLPTIRPYVIFYEVRENEVFILSIRHGAQRPAD